MKEIDQQYCGIPWKDGGRTRAGVDCVGLVWLWLQEQAGITTEAPQTTTDTDAESYLQGGFNEAALQRGDVVFFRSKAGKVRHVALYLGENKYLHIFNGVRSRIENGLTLLRRIGCVPVGSISSFEVERLANALKDPQLAGWETAILIAIAVILSVVSYLLTPSLAGFKNRAGRYGDNALITQKNPEIPLPDILGTVTVAGNSVYQQLPNKSATVSNDPPQKWNQVIVLASGPCEEIDPSGIQVNGMSYSDKYFNNSTHIDGISLDPDQTKAAAVTGTIGTDTDVPTLSLYDGAYDINVPVDVRAQYDRNFPIYGFSGCSYVVLRGIDSSKFQNFNFTARVKCRKCRTFDEDGFTVLTASSEDLPGADGTKVRFKLAHEDIQSVTSLTIGATSYSEISASSQTGNVFSLNRLKGYVEFLSAPAGSSTITITYDYYEREWTQNPANHVVYLLTEKGRGKGFAADRISWVDAVAARDFFDEEVTWVSSSGTFTSKRYETNYSIDYRKPIQDHIQALLDACQGMLFLSSGKFVLKARKTEESVFSFDTSNILLEDGGESSFEATLADRAPKANRVKLFYHSEDTLNSETEADADDEDNQRDRADRVGNNGVVEENLKIPAVTTVSQAERLAETYLREHVGSNWLFRWKTNIQGLALQPGDVVDVTHPSLSASAVLLRIDTLEYDEDDHLVISASEYVPSAYI